MANEAIRREYPVALIATLNEPSDLALPRELTPAFCGSFDWHSAVHGHWTLARSVRLHPDADWAGPARAALASSLTRANLEREHAFVERRPGFERPYGLGWLLQLTAELRLWDDARRASGSALEPLRSWPRGGCPRVGWEGHSPSARARSQSAFSSAWRSTGRAMRSGWRMRAARGGCSRLYRADVSAPVGYRPLTCSRPRS
jgi:hypothetical protein